MSKNFDETRISEAMKKDLEEFRRTGVDAIYMLGNGMITSTDQVITRLQTADIANIALSGLDTMEGWAAPGNSLRDVRSSLPPMSSTGKYSSYALKETDYENIRYPLVASFKSKTILFENKTFPTYQDLINRIQKSYKVKIEEKRSGGPLFTYKRNGKVTAMLKNIGLGIVNLCRKIFRKDAFKSQPNYKGKISINGFLTAGGRPYKISEQEKFTKIMDALGGVTVKKTAKDLKVKLSKEELFVSRVFADILVSRAINYGDVATNKKVEASLNLQLSNALAGLNLSSEQLAIVSRVGLDSAVEMVEKLGLSLDEVKSSVTAAGYVYADEPASIREALLPRRSLESVAVPYEIEVLEPDGYVPNFVFAERREEMPEQRRVPLLTEKKDLEGVKEDPSNFLTANKAKKYVDEVILNNFKKNIKSAIRNLKNIEATAKNINGAAWQRKISVLRRQCDFIEHMYTFYGQNKDLSDEDLLKLVETELSVGEVNDNVYAHSFAKSFVDLRRSIIDGIFGENDRVEIAGGDAATVINKYMKENFYADTPRTSSLLSSYIAETLETKIKPMFEKIDSNEFEPVDLTKAN